MTDRITLLTARADLQAVAERWCSALGVGAVSHRRLADARRFWATSDAVVVGEDLAAELAAARWPRRDHVFLLADDPNDWWRVAVEIGGAGVLRARDGDESGVAALAQVVDGGSEGCSVSVVGGRGGVGATTFSCALALEAATRELSAVVMDADPVGPGVDLVLGGERTDGLRWSDLDSTVGLVSPGALAGALPRVRGISTVSWSLEDDTPELPESCHNVWSAAVRGFDLVVVDQPRTGVDADWTVGVLGGSVLTVVIVPDDVVGVAAARRQIAALRERCSDLVAVTATRRGGPGRSAIESAVAVPVVASIRHDTRVRVALDRGRGPARSRGLRRPAREVLDLIGLV
ncbi:MAG TPA: septum site-determining protein Ssd [Aeromicrobium sp.]|nr:septum site-determining protein Ssd [Aeromicrobium sp.]